MHLIAWNVPDPNRIDVSGHPARSSSSIFNLQISPPHIDLLRELKYKEVEHYEVMAAMTEVYGDALHSRPDPLKPYAPDPRLILPSLMDQKYSFCISATGSAARPFAGPPGYPSDAFYHLCDAFPPPDNIRVFDTPTVSDRLTANVAEYDLSVKTCHRHLRMLHAEDADDGLDAVLRSVGPHTHENGRHELFAAEWYLRDPHWHLPCAILALLREGLRVIELFPFSARLDLSRTHLNKYGSFLKLYEDEALRPFFERPITL
ncbi:MAG: hypothetical protein ACOCWQ_04350 [Nanoarchaeota archaeon]